MRESFMIFLSNIPLIKKKQKIKRFILEALGSCGKTTWSKMFQIPKRFRYGMTVCFENKEGFDKALRLKLIKYNNHKIKITRAELKSRFDQLSLDENQSQFSEASISDLSLGLNLLTLTDESDDEILYLDTDDELI